MSNYEFTFKRADGSNGKGTVRGNSLTQALAEIRKDEGADIKILGYNQFPPF